MDVEATVCIFCATIKPLLEIGTARNWTLGQKKFILNRIKKRVDVDTAKAINLMRLEQEAIFIMKSSRGKGLIIIPNLGVIMKTKPSRYGSLLKEGFSSYSDKFIRDSSMIHLTQNRIFSHISSFSEINSVSISSYEILEILHFNAIFKFIPDQKNKILTQRLHRIYNQKLEEIV